MDKRVLVTDIKSQFDGSSALSVTQVAKYLGVCRETARVFLRDVEHFKAGTEKRYLVLDIANKIYESRKYS